MALSFASIIRPFHVIGAQFRSKWHLEAVSTCVQVRSLTMRPVEPSDAGLVSDLLLRLSEPACWLRYNRPRLAPATVQCEVERMLRGDRAGAIALLATVRWDRTEEAVALAEVIAADSQTAEVAIVVRDDYQGQGLGSALMCQIVSQAISQGLRTLRFDIRRGNTAMQCLVRGLGLPYRRADWIDPVFVAVSGDELRDQRCGRSISAAKKAEACLRIVFARRSSRFSRSNCAIRSASLVVVPGRTPPSTSACLTQVRSASGCTPS